MTYVLLLSTGRAIPSNGCLTVLLCTVQLDSSLFTFFILKLSPSAPFTCDYLKAGRSFLKTPAICKRRYHVTFLLVICSFKQTLFYTIFRLQSKCLIISFSLPGPWGSFSISLFTFVAVLCGGCQAPAKTSLTGLFSGDWLPALKYTKFGFWNPTALWGQCYPSAARLRGPFCCDSCPGSCPARLCAGGRAPHFVLAGAACAPKHRFL